MYNHIYIQLNLLSNYCSHIYWLLSSLIAIKFSLCIANSSDNNVHFTCQWYLSYITAIGPASSNSLPRLIYHEARSTCQAKMPAKLLAVARRPDGLRDKHHVDQNIPTLKLYYLTSGRQRLYQTATKYDTQKCHSITGIFLMCTCNKSTIGSTNGCR